MHQPEGFKEHGKDWVCRLYKGLYGLKQSGRLWNDALNRVLTGMGFRRIESDHSVYVWERDDCKVIVPVFVDDLTIAARKRSAVNAVIDELERHFSLRRLGDTSFMLGVKITRERPKRTLRLSQRQYIIDMLEDYGFSGCTPVQTPMEPGLHLTKDMSPKTDAERAEMREVPYINAVGALMYLATCTRPDIAYTVSLLEDDGVMSPYLAYISFYSPPIPSIPACHESPIYILHFIHEQLSLNLTS